MTELLTGKTAIIYGGGGGIGGGVAQTFAREGATFLASDRAAGMTGAMANVTSGLVHR